MVGRVCISIIIYIYTYVPHNPRLLNNLFIYIYLYIVYVIYDGWMDEGRIDRTCVM